MMAFKNEDTLEARRLLESELRNDALELRTPCWPNS